MSDTMDTTEAREKLKAAYLIDDESGESERRFALVRRTGRARNRFPETCVEVKGSREEALAGVAPEGQMAAAVVYGPCRSSEGIRLFYLVEWL